MTPSQSKVLKHLQNGPKSRQDLVFKTKLNYYTVHKALVYLMETVRVTTICIDKVTHYLPKQEKEFHGETTVQRAIRNRPALQAIWMN